MKIESPLENKSCQKHPRESYKNHLKLHKKKSSFRSPSDAAYKSPNPSINYRPPSVSVPYAISAKKYGFCQTNVKMRRQKENMLIYQMPTFLQNRELSRANRLIACRKTDANGGATIVAFLPLFQLSQLFFLTLQNFLGSNNY